MGRRDAPRAPALLAAEMARRNLTREQLATELDVTAGALGTWLRGESSPRVQTALAIAEWSGGAVPVEAWA